MKADELQRRGGARPTWRHAPLARRLRLAVAAIVTCTATLTMSDRPAAWTNFDLYLWPDGRVPYRWADANDTDWWGVQAVPLTANQQAAVQAEMVAWKKAMKLADPADPAQLRQYVQFDLCAGRCEDEDNYLVIRLNNNTLFQEDGVTPREGNNMCGWRQNGFDVPGRNPAQGGATTLHFAPNLVDSNTLRHELGHCLGLWHEFNRADRDFWLDERPDVDGPAAWDAAGFSIPLDETVMPELGNFDYDSLMNYGSISFRTLKCVLWWTDLLGNQFERRGLDMSPKNDAASCRIFPPGAGGTEEDQVSARDKSRILQYYARETQPTWGFFESLATRPGWYDFDGQPDPYLAPGVRAVGTPAVAFQFDGHFDVFARGSDRRLYWKAFRRQLLPRRDVVSAWIPLGCCFASDPAAISRGGGQIDLVAIHATGRPVINHFANLAWQGWAFVAGRPPDGQLRQIAGGDFIGPAITSRDGGLDVFVVRADGRLAVTTLWLGMWQNWQTLGNGYEVTARPAAVATSSRVVRLAINEREVNLYEPRVVFGLPLVVGFELGGITAQTARFAAPGLTPRADTLAPYRVLTVTQDQRIAHKLAGGRWRDIGGIPAPDTGISAAGMALDGALMVINGEDVTACVRTCLAGQPNPGGVIQPGGVWLREFR